MKIMWDQTPREIWDALTDHSGAAMQQRWLYGAAIAALGRDVLRVEVRQSGAPVALIQFLSRRFVRAVPIVLASRGPIWINPFSASARAEVMLKLSSELRQRGLRFILVTPEQSDDDAVLAQARFKDVMSPATVATLSLQGDLRAAMAGKWRNRLVASEASGLTLRSIDGSFANHKWLIAEDAKQGRARGYRGHPPAFLRAWHELSAKNVVTMAAHQGATRVAAMMFLVHGTTATYQLGWSSDAGRAVSAHNFLLAQAMERFVSMGITAIDLGQLDTEGGKGLARFKLGSGARADRLGSTWLRW